MDSDPTMKALEFFKDWSNYLLVTTVAALGWIAEHGDAGAWEGASMWCLGLAAVFGVLTLALIPLVAEQRQEGDRSIFQVRTSFSILGRSCHAYIPQACRPQHVLFMAGLLLYCISKSPSPCVTGLLYSAALGTIVVGGVVVGLLSTPKR